MANPPSWALTWGPDPPVPPPGPPEFQEHPDKTGITLLIEISFICESHRVHLLSCAKEVRPASRGRASLELHCVLPKSLPLASLGPLSPHTTPKTG